MQYNTPLNISDSLLRAARQYSIYSNRLSWFPRLQSASRDPPADFVVYSITAAAVSTINTSTVVQLYPLSTVVQYYSCINYQH